MFRSELGALGKWGQTPFFANYLAGRKMGTVPIFLAFLVLACAARAEIRTMTLRQAVETAIQQNPDLALSRLDEEKARQAVREARDPFFPRIVVGSGLAYSNGFPMSIEGSAPAVLTADRRGRIKSTANWRKPG